MQINGLGRFGPSVATCALVLLLVFSLPPFATSQPPSRANSPPDAVAMADITTGVIENDDVILDGSNSTDEALASCTITWTCNDPAITISPASDPRNASFKATVKGVLLFELYIKDPEGLEDTDSVSITVVANQAPKSRIASPVDGAVFIKGDEVSFDGATSSDPESRPLSFRWTSNVSGQISTQKAFTHAFDDLGWHRITLNVSDPNGGFNVAAISIKVRDPPAPPVARANVPKTVYYKGEPIAFDGTLTTDPNKDDRLNYTWRTDIGSGRTIGYGSVLTLALEEGVHNVTLNVTDSDLLSDEDSIKVTVKNQPPEPRIAGPEIVNVSQIGQFSAFSTIDKDNDPLSFVWDFGDGFREIGVNVSHAWSDWGNYQVNLTVDDGSALENTAIDTMSVKVNSIPISAINLTGNPIVGEPTQFRANCTDPDGDKLSYRWDFDNDMVYEIQGLTATHTFEEEGEYVVTLEASDGFATSTATLTVQATFPNEVPIADAGPDLIGALEDGRGEVTLDGSRSYDPDDDPDGNGRIEGRERDNLTYRWDFDTSKDSDRDGIADNDIDGKGKTVRYVLKEEGPFTVSLNVTDKRGRWAQDLLSVRGDNPPQISSLVTSPSGRALAGGTVTFTASIKDPDRSDDGKLAVTWEIDGTKKTGTKVTHVFSTPGMKEAVATVTDGYLNTSSTIEISIDRLLAPKITTPSNGSDASGSVMIRGTAVPAGGGIIKLVEISINDGPWLKCNKVTPDWKNWYYEWDSAEGKAGNNVVKVRVGVESGGVTVYSTSQLVLVKGSASDSSGLNLLYVVPVVVIILMAAVIAFFFLRRRGTPEIEIPPNGGQFAPGPPTMAPMPGPTLPSIPVQQNLRPGPPAPTPPQPPKEKTIRIKCPACGGMFAYRDTGERPIHLVCDHCGAKGVIDAPTLAAPSSSSPAQRTEGKGKPLTIVCPGCSGLFEIADRVDTLKCPFCGAEGDLDEETLKVMDELFGPVPNMITLRCPKCSEMFDVKEGEHDIACPHCGVRGKI